MHPGWVDLPREVRDLILKVFVRDSYPLSRIATVSREWQEELKRHIWARIKVTPSRLPEFNSMTCRNRALVKYIWFCLEVKDYNCTTCAPDHQQLADEEWEETFNIVHADGWRITTAFEILFSILSTWDPHGDLVLDISLHSPSDSDHWFKYLTFTPDLDSNSLDDGMDLTISNSDEPQHGWIAGVRHSAPPSNAFRKIFDAVMALGPFDSEQLEQQWWDQLPSVSVVTSLLLRQQNRRRWKPESLGHILARFPRLQEFHYEPWREWDFPQRLTDRRTQYLFNSLSQFNTNLKRLVVFENFNQQYPATMQLWRNGVDFAQCDSIRKPSSAVSQTLALASLKLEHLAASFLVDASYFFSIDPSWEWSRLKSIALTSQLLTHDEDPIKIGVMLRAAAAAAIKMPLLEVMEIWNGRRELAALFKFQVFDDMQATITWRATWELTMESSIFQAWETVVNHHYHGYKLDFVQEWLDQAAIKSHGDAVHSLMLSSQVIRPVSLQQILTEQKFLQSVPT